MRLTKAIARTPPPILAIILAIVPHAACSQEAQPPPPPATAQISVAFDSQLSDPLSLLLSQWESSQGTTVVALPAASTAITFSAQDDHSPPDVLVITAQTPLPTQDRAPISARPWITDPLVFFTKTEEPRTPDQILIDPQARIAIAIEAGPMGQYTRFGLRKLRRWDLVKGRVFRHSDPAQIMDAVHSGDAAMGIIYATFLAKGPQGLKQRAELEVTESARRDYLVIAQTTQGIELARWLTQPAQTSTTAQFGYAPAPTLKPTDNTPQED